nr:capsid protein [Cressdnaviricota sp.]
MAYTRRRAPFSRRKKPFRRRVKRRFIRKTPLFRSVGIPKCRYTKLRWAQHFQFSLSSSAGVTADFRLNGPYDPLVAAGGTQPYYFDQYTAMYQRYRVYGCKVTIRACCTCASSNIVWPTMMLTSYCDAAPAWSTMDVASTSKGSILKIVPCNQNSVVISKYFNLPQLSGTAKREYNVAEVFQALCSTLPTRSMNCTVWWQNDASTDITPSYWIHMTYYVKFFDPVEPAGS